MMNPSYVLEILEVLELGLQLDPSARIQRNSWCPIARVFPPLESSQVEIFFYISRNKFVAKW